MALANEQERLLVQRLLDGDEATFTALVECYHESMIRLARTFVRDPGAAEEVVQEAWVGVIKGLASFKGNSSIKSWIFAITVNKAKTRGKREARSVPFSALVQDEVSGVHPAVDPDRFLGPEAQWPGHWMQPPRPWGDNPEVRLLQADAMAQLRSVLDRLPPAQRSVVTLKDVAGLDPESICNELGITETNMRVLLHRARSRIRGELERYFDEQPSGN